MKETHIFYAPRIAEGDRELPAEEASHAVRVLRMKEGDALTLTDGMGFFYEAHITMATAKHCAFCIEHTIADKRSWQSAIHVAVAPTKNMDRMEWFTEKATEIGIDSITLLDCAFSERRVVKTERLEKIAVSAMKQSHKAFKPVITPMTPFARFISQTFEGQRFIAHCYDAQDETDGGQAIHLSTRNFLGDLVSRNTPTLVLIGPEGDFSIGEVEAAIQAGFTPISLGESRLRTETAALVATHLMYLGKR